MNYIMVHGCRDVRIMREAISHTAYITLPGIIVIGVCTFLGLFLVLFSQKLGCLPGVMYGMYVLVCAALNHSA